MRFRRLQSPPSAGKINVTPLIDVVMCLIVFYLIVGKLASDKKAKIALPKSGVGVVEASRRDLTITVSRAGSATSVLLDGQTTGMEALESALRLREGGAGVRIRADRRLTYADVSPVIDACRRAGLASVKLTTERVGEGGGR